MRKKIQQPPQWALVFFRWFCRPEFAEDIEGDLMERFHFDQRRSGSFTAGCYFVLGVFSLLRPAIVRNPILFQNLNSDNMNRKNWINLVLFNVFVLVIISLPFLPGPPNRMVIGLSGLLQSAGFLGLIFLPMGLIWLIIELVRLRKPTQTVVLRGWAYGFGIAALVIAMFISIIFCMVVFAEAGMGWGMAAILTFVIVFFFLFKELRKQRVKQFSFSPACLYLLSVPLISLAARKTIIQPLSEMSRVKTIEQANQIISAIEIFNDKNYRYPESLSELQQSDASVNPNPSIMGVLNFRYNRINSGYSLSFSQWLDMGSLEEIVLYDKYGLRNIPQKYDYSNDLVRVNYAFDSYDTKFTDWRYYHSD